MVQEPHLVHIFEEIDVLLKAAGKPGIPAKTKHVLRNSAMRSDSTWDCGILACLVQMPQST